ncbi:MAG: thiamine-phosphate kinase [Candidatus Firestonebacteria bacterium]
MKLSRIGEFKIIDLIRKSVKLNDKRVLVGLGDDCAVVREDSKKLLMATTDMLVEDVHFILKFSPYLLGKKSMLVNVSDIVSMGGIPRYALVSIGLPRTITVGFVKSLYKGIQNVCREFNIDLIGGDTVFSHKVVINISLLGEIEKGKFLLRSSAKVDDYILVTGFLGDGASHLLENKIYIPEIRLDFVRELVRHNLVNAMIDISDGLSSEINHIVVESNVGAEIFENNIPISNHTLKAAKLYKKNAHQLALNGGEDYELLFTVSPENLFNTLRLARNNVKVSVLGRIVSKKFGVAIINKNGKREKLRAKGYDHFAQN